MASSSKEQELAIKIAGKVENSFKQSLGVTEDGLNKIASTAKKAAAIAAAAFATLSVGNFIAGAVDEYSEFEQSMANTSAIAGATSEEYEKMSNAAREAGKATTFTASQAADALGYMALAGWDVNESTTALTPILKLAEATQADLATTSDQVTDSMSAMGVGIDELQSYLDAVVKTNNKANTSSAELMDAFIGCGGAARSAGMNYQETATALGILGNNGKKGAEAGTILNSMLVRISTKDVAQKAFKELGVAVYDSSGEMRNMRDILVDTDKALSGLTEEQQNNYEAAIAGTNYFSEFGYLLDGVREGADGSASAWDELADAIENSEGALDAMDATVTGTLQGAMAKFQSAISDLKISLVENFGPYATKVINKVAEALPRITSNLSKIIQKMPIGEFVGGIGSMAEGVLDFLSMVTSGQSVLDAFSIMLGEDFGVEMPEIVQKVIQIFSDFLTKLKEVAGFLTETAITAFQKVKDKITENEPAINNVIQLANNLKNRLFEAFEHVKPTITFVAETALPRIVDGLMTVVSKAADVLNKFTQWEGFLPTVTGIAAAIAGFKLTKVSVGIGKVTKAMGLLRIAKIKDRTETLYLNALYAKDAIAKAASTAATRAHTIATNVSSVAQTAFNAVMSANPIALVVLAIVGLVAAFVVAYNKSEKFRAIVQKAFEVIKNVAGTVLTAIGNFFKKAWEEIQSVWNAVKPYFEQIWNVIKEIFSTVVSVLGGFFKAAWYVIQQIWNAVKPYFQSIWNTIKSVFSVVVSVLGGFFKAAWAVIKGVWSIAGQYFAMIWNNIKAVFVPVVQVISSFFKNAWEAIKAVWNVVSGYFEMIWNTIKGIFSVVKNVLSGNFSGAWEAIKGIFAGFASFFQTLWDSVKSIFGAVGDFFATVFSSAWQAITGVFSNVASFFKGVWDKIVSIFKSVGTAISDAISGAVKGAINTVLNGAAGIINGFISAINFAIGIINAIPGVNINKLKPLEVPQLATGGIVSNPTLAMIGEGKQQEAVVPLDTLWDKMRTMFASILSERQNGALGNALSALVDKVRAALQGNSQTPFSGLLDKLNSVNSSSSVPATLNGIPITYAPVYNFNGPAPNKDDIVEAEKMSQAEFNQMMEKWQRDNDRKRF